MRLERQVDVAHPLGTAAHRRRTALHTARVFLRRTVGLALFGPLVISTVALSLQTTDVDRARSMVRRYALEAFPQWAQHAYDRMCPRSIDELNAHVGRYRATDAWGTELTLTCSAAYPPIVVSAGPDRTFGTRDDITSLE